MCVLRISDPNLQREKKPTKIFYMGFKMYKIYKMLMKQLQLDDKNNKQEELMVVQYEVPNGYTGFSLELDPI